MASRGDSLAVRAVSFGRNSVTVSRTSSKIFRSLTSPAIDHICETVSSRIEMVSLESRFFSHNLGSRYRFLELQLRRCK